MFGRLKSNSFPDLERNFPGRYGSFSHDEEKISEDCQIDIEEVKNDTGEMSGFSSATGETIRRLVLSGTPKDFDKLAQLIEYEGLTLESVIRFMFSQAFFTIGNVSSLAVSKSPLMESLQPFLDRSPDWLVSQLLPIYESALIKQKRMLITSEILYLISLFLLSGVCISLGYLVPAEAARFFDITNKWMIYTVFLSAGMGISSGVYKLLVDAFDSLFMKVKRRIGGVEWTPANLMSYFPESEPIIATMVAFLGVDANLSILDENIRILIQAMVARTEQKFIEYLFSKGYSLLRLDYSMTGDRSRDSHYILDAAKRAGLQYCYVLCKDLESGKTTLSMINIHKNGHYDFKLYREGLDRGTRAEPWLSDLSALEVHPLSRESLKQLHKCKSVWGVGEHRKPLLVEQGSNIIQHFAMRRELFFSKIMTDRRENLKREASERNIFML